MKKIKLLLFIVPLIFVAATCQNTQQKSIYTAAILADGAMQSYAVYWKNQTNASGLTPSLEAQRTQVMQLSSQVGAGIALADQTLAAFNGNLGTNTATKAVLDAVIATAIQRASDLAAYVGSITGNTNYLK